ncbi:MAG TPA: nicotinate-nucleotide adenylyltransferase [Gammaproteobacteria bacterium]|nr:nicotinate-nucleotide adenylyltransferase [Gammaproteobacteria bacterium]
MICILGGTFDPVHYGHLRPALEVRQALGIDQVRLLPAGRPPHRHPPQASAGQRLAMLELAVQDEPALAIDARELRRDGPSYMADTLRELREEIGDEPLCLALGMDALQGLDSWHDWHAIPALCHLLVMERPGSRWPRSGELLKRVARARVDDVDALHGQAAGLIAGIRVTQLDISASAIRRMLADGHSPRFLLPDRVLDYIYEQGLYLNAEH